MRQAGTDHWCYKHGAAPRNSKPSPEYRAYVASKARCSNPLLPEYKYYGGRGIEFRFESFEQFLTEIGARPSNNHSIDRINNDGHYEPGNVRWATRRQQMLNRRCSRTLTLDGRTLHLFEWMEILSLKKATILSRQRLGWCDVCVLTKPLKQGTKQFCLCAQK